MPQIILTLSNNIDITQIDFTSLFVLIHDELKNVPGLDVTTCNSGVVQESFSYIGLGNEKLTKAFLEIRWMDTEERRQVKSQIAAKLMVVLETELVPQIEEQHLICIPRVRIGDLGKLGVEYFISQAP